MHYIPSSMHKTDVQKKVLKTIDQNTLNVEPKVQIMEYGWVVMVV